VLSIAPLASPDYYLGAAASSGEAFHYFAGDAISPFDPLLRQGRWLGHLGSDLGLNPDAPVTAKDFESIYYGLHPGTGQPLRTDGKSRKAQMRDSKQRAACQQVRHAALRSLNQARKQLREVEAHGLDTLDANAMHVQCKQAFAIADKALRQAQQKSLRPGSDLVFSAPKSVSMQWAALAASGDKFGAKAIESAHDRAVRTTFERMQTDFVMTRKRDGGGSSQRVFETVQGVIACQWRHFDARPTESLAGNVGSAGAGGETRDGAVDADGANADQSALAGIPDPQLHDHINLFAPVRGADGAIYAAYTDFIRQNIKSLGAMYRAHLSQHLVEAGYQIERDAQKNGLFFSLCGVGRDQAKALSARAADIEGLVGAGVSPRDAKLFSRKAKNRLGGSDVLQAWSGIFEALELDPKTVMVSTLADSIAREAVSRSVPDAALPSFTARMLRERQAGVRTDTQILEALLQRDAYFSLSDIRQLLWEDAQFVGMQHVPGMKALDLDAYVESRMRSLLRSPDLLKVVDPNAPYHAGYLTGLNRFGEPVFTTHSLRARETRLFGQTVAALLKSSGFGVDKELAMRIIQETESRLSAASVASGGKPFALRDFQLRAVLQAACGDGQLCVQIAGAGMGKTTSAQFIKEILTAQGRQILGVAPSNKAATGLGRELGIATSSIDRLLLDLQAGRQTLDRNTVVFVDEAGMAGFDVMEKLFELAAQSGAKLILTGDPEQLPAVARGNVLRKLTQMEALTSTADALMYLGRNLADWNRISRQKQDWAKQASMYFSQGFVGEGLREYESRNCVHGAMTATHLGEDIAQAYLQDPAIPAQKLILATTNAQVKALNAVVRDRLKAAGKLHGAWKLPDTGMELSLGDRLVFKERQPIEENTTQETKRKDANTAKPALRANIAKNEFATVMAISRKPDGSLDLLCQLDTPKDDGAPNLVRLNSRAMGEIDHAFATTVHRSQGMTVDSVFAVPGTFLSKELFYVMATRHRERLHIHMLESDRATLLAKASQNMTKLHAWDLTDAERAGGQPTSGVLVRLQASTDRLFALMQRERARFEAVISGSVRTAIQLPLVQTGVRSIRDVGSTLERILSCASAVRRDVGRLLGGSRHEAQSRSQTGQQVQPEQLGQSR
jgi:hypothetical protein